MCDHGGALGRRCARDDTNVRARGASLQALRRVAVAVVRRWRHTLSALPRRVLCARRALPRHRRTTDGALAIWRPTAAQVYEQGPSGVLYAVIDETCASRGGPALCTSVQHDVVMQCERVRRLPSLRIVYMKVHCVARNAISRTHQLACCQHGPKDVGPITVRGVPSSLAACMCSGRAAHALCAMALGPPHAVVHL